MEKINITRGNEFTLRVTLRREDELFPVEISEDVSCCLVSCIGVKTALTHTITDEGTLMVDVDGTAASGDYILEVCGTLAGRKWRTASDVLRITTLTEQGDGSVTVTGDSYDIVMSVQLYKSTIDVDEAISGHNQDEEAHPYIQGLIPTLPDHIVTDEHYNHTDNNFTDDEKEKLAGLANYDDTEVKDLIDTKQDTITDLSGIRGGAALGTTAYQKPETGIPYSDMSSQVKEGLDNANAAKQAVETIEGYIPSSASTDNQLADKDFVNSSIATSTATFQGTYDTLEELQAVTADANDYGFVVGKDAAGNTTYSRYKYVEGTGWVFEYTLNNSSFTAAQWAAINSAITGGDVEKLSALPTNTELAQLLEGKADKTTVEHVAFDAGSKEECILKAGVIMECSFVDVMTFAIEDTPQADEKEEYCIKFDTGDTIPTVSFPAVVVWADELELEENAHYVILINRENGGYYGDWKAYYKEGSV